MARPREFSDVMIKEAQQLRSQGMTVKGIQKYFELTYQKEPSRALVSIWVKGIPCTPIPYERPRGRPKNSPKPSENQDISGACAACRSNLHGLCETNCEACHGG